LRLELAAELAVADQNPVYARARTLDPRAASKQVPVALDLDEPSHRTPRSAPTAARRAPREATRTLRAA